jgi:hypothetical protein
MVAWWRTHFKLGLKVCALFHEELGRIWTVDGHCTMQRSHPLRTMGNRRLAYVAAGRGSGGTYRAAACACVHGR